MRIRKAIWVALYVALIAFFVFFFIWPILSLLKIGLFDSGSFEASKFLAVLQADRTWRVIIQTLAQALGATVIASLLGVLAAFVLYKLQFKSQKFFRVLISIPFVLPTIVVGIAFSSLYGPGGILNFLGIDNTNLVIVLALSFFNISVVMRVTGAFWQQLDEAPAEVAKTLGASPSRVFLTITLPLLTRPIISGASLVFLFSASSFGVVFVLGAGKIHTIETEIYRSTMQLFDLQTASVLAIVQTIIIVLAIFLTTRFTPDFQSAVTKKVSGRLVPRNYRTPFVLFWISIFFLQGLPLLSLLVRSLRSVTGNWSFENYLNLLFESGSTVFNMAVLDSLRLSFIFSSIASVVALFLGTILVVLVTRKISSKTTRIFAYTLQQIGLMPLGISAVVLGLGLLITMNRPLGIGIDVRTSVLLIPIAQILIALPLVIRTLMPALQSVKKTLKESAATLGATPARVLFTIELHQVLGVIGVAFGLAFATAFGEFGAASFLVRPGDKTFPVLVGEMISSPDPSRHAMGMAGAQLIAILVALIMVLVETASGKKGVRGF